MSSHSAELHAWQTHALQTFDARPAIASPTADRSDTSRDISDRRHRPILGQRSIATMGSIARYPGATAAIGGAGINVLKTVQPGLRIPNPVIPADDGLTLQPWTGQPLTVGGEINKLAFNMAFGRDTAGVHFRRDEVRRILL